MCLKSLLECVSIMFVPLSVTGFLGCTMMSIQSHREVAYERLLCMFQKENGYITTKILIQFNSASLTLVMISGQVSKKIGSMLQVEFLKNEPIESGTSHLVGTPAQFSCGLGKL